MNTPEYKRTKALKVDLHETLFLKIHTHLEKLSNARKKKVKIKDWVTEVIEKALSARE